MAKIQLFPQRTNVGSGFMKGEFFNEQLAKRMVKTKLWDYVPRPSTQDDINQLVDKAKKEVSEDMRIIAAEKERLQREREELEALRAELLTNGTTKVGRKKAEV